MRGSDTIPNGPDESRPADDGDGTEELATKHHDGAASMSERLQASSKMALNAMAGWHLPPDAVPDQKATAGPSTSSQLPTKLGEASSTQPPARVGEPLRLPRFVSGSSQAFDTFVSQEPQPGTLPATEHGLLESTDECAHTSFADQEAADGAEVLQLLSLSDDAMFAPPAEGEALSPSEAARLQEALFGSGNETCSAPRWDSLLSLMPHFIAQPSAASSHEAQLHMGTADVAAAQSAWLQQWSDVLSSYTDEVWGDLGPLAAEAKRDVDQQMLGKQPAGSESSETKALGRLRLILAHVCGRG